MLDRPHDALAGGVRDRDLGIEQSPEVDGASEQEQHDRRDERELDQGLAAGTGLADSRSGKRTMSHPGQRYESTRACHVYLAPPLHE